MDQGSGLQGVLLRLRIHFGGGEFAQFLIDQREQFIRSLRIALLNGPEYAGDFAHGLLLPNFAAPRQKIDHCDPLSGVNRPMVQIYSCSW